jgi:hypothetical protein
MTAPGSTVLFPRESRKFITLFGVSMSGRSIGRKERKEMGGLTPGQEQP